MLLAPSRGGKRLRGLTTSVSTHNDASPGEKSAGGSGSGHTVGVDEHNADDKASTDVKPQDGGSAASARGGVATRQASAGGVRSQGRTRTSAVAASPPIRPPLDHSRPRGSSGSGKGLGRPAAVAAEGSSAESWSGDRHQQRQPLHGDGRAGETARIAAGGGSAGGSVSGGGMTRDVDQAEGLGAGGSRYEGPTPSIAERVVGWQMAGGKVSGLVGEDGNPVSGAVAGSNTSLSATGIGGDQDIRANPNDGRSDGAHERPRFQGGGTTTSPGAVAQGARKSGSSGGGAKREVGVGRAGRESGGRGQGRDETSPRETISPARSKVSKRGDRASGARVKRQKEKRNGEITNKGGGMRGVEGSGSGQRVVFAGKGVVEGRESGKGAVGAGRGGGLPARVVDSRSRNGHDRQHSAGSVGRSETSRLGASDSTRALGDKEKTLLDVFLK